LIIARFLAGVAELRRLEFGHPRCLGLSRRFFVFARIAERFTQQKEQVRYNRFWLPTLG
jgi:hypothetical protein